MSLFGSRHAEQSSPPGPPEPSTEVARLLEQAREDYQRHNSPETQATAREFVGQARISGNEAAWVRWGR